VYVVVVVIVPAVTVPPETGVTEPTPWSIEKETPFCVVQVSTGAPLPTKECGAAESVQTGCTVVTVMVSEQ
jgi:hypothetical protein